MRVVTDVNLSGYSFEIWSKGAVPLQLRVPQSPRAVHPILQDPQHCGVTLLPCHPTATLGQE